jgi:hypothetical protein
MGTRHLVAFTANGKTKAMYGQYDGYISGVGQTVLDFCRKGIGSDTIEKVTKLIVVPEGAEPTPTQANALSKYSDGRVSTGADWYATLRECQGDPALILESGYILDSFNFGYDGIFCEYAYVLDFDKGCLDVYKGYQDKLNGLNGLWNDTDRWEPSHDGSKKFGVQKVASFKFNDLPSDEDFLALEG